MHQPYYKDPLTGEFSLPWVRLHGIKDYLDMLEILQGFPQLHQTFNLVPSLIEQLDEYAKNGLETKDEFLILSKKDARALSADEQDFILMNFFMANWEHMVRPFPRYYDLLEKRGVIEEVSELSSVRKYFSNQDYLDLQVLFNLAWFDPSFKETDPSLKELIKKGAYFTEEEKKLVLEKQTEIIKRIIPAYKSFQDAGQIEISVSPYFHPILPLVCDSNSAKASYRDIKLPNSRFNFPIDAAWHIQNAVKSYEKHFSKKPRGMWPSEGSVSEEILPLVIGSGINWLASDEEILFKSISKPRSNSLLFKPYQLKRKNGSTNIIFRDKSLSDLIGFTYSHWQPKQAVDDFLRRLYIIKNELNQKEGEFLVPIILDGENAWEYYPNDGRDFLLTLYKRFAQDPSFKLTTVSEFLEIHPAESEISELFPGSWINANFNIWIGHQEKNKAWDYLYNARDFLSKLGERDSDSKKNSEAWRHIYIAEGSDWNWWFGDDHSSGNDEEFDRLFRENLKAVYALTNHKSPEYLDFPIRVKVVKSQLEPSALITPDIDGKVTNYFEWLQAGVIEIEKLAGAMHRGNLILKRVYYGFDMDNLYLRFNINKGILKEARVTIILDIKSSFISRIRLPLSSKEKGIKCERYSLSQNGSFKRLSTDAKAVFKDILECSISFSELEVKNIEFIELRALVEKDSDISEQLPDSGYIKISLPNKDYDLCHWYV